MIRRSWTRTASIEETLALLAASLRDDMSGARNALVMMLNGNHDRAARSCRPHVAGERVVRAIGVDRCCALIFPVNSVAEMNEQVEWFATGVIKKVDAGVA